MSDEQTTAERGEASVTPIREATNEAKPSPTKPERSRPTRTLPTNRVAFSKQLEIDRAFAIASGQDNRPASTADVANIVRLHRATIQLVTPFLQDAGLIAKAAGGYMPTEPTVNFSRAWTWAADTAGHRLAPAIRDTWFAGIVLQRAALHPLDEREAIQSLGEAASAGKEYEAQVRMLLDYLETAGLITREGGMIRVASPQPAPTQQPASEPTRSEAPVQEQTQPAAPAPRVSTTFAKDVEGGLQFSVNFRMSASDFEGWPRDRIAAFFAGIAQVLMAKGGMETDEA